MADGSIRSSSGNSQVTSSPAWKYWVLPSVADLIFVALLCVLVFTPLSVKLLGDAGIGWHIRTGQLIVATHAIPRVDLFSTQIRKPWIAWEWLYDVAVGKLDSWCGLNGVIWLTAFVIAVVFAWVFRLLMVRGTNLFIALVLTLLAVSASTIHFLARPHVLTWLFTLVWFWILDSHESAIQKSAHRRIWLLPLLILVWVNVHGGFLLGFVLLAIFWLGSLWTWLTLKEVRIESSLEKIAAGKRVRELTLVGLCCVVASLVNPYGWNLHAHIYSYLTNRFFMDHIDEFQSPNFHGIAQKCFLVLLLIAIAAIVAQGRKLRASEILLLLFAVYSGLYSSRNIPLSAVFLVLIVGPLIPSFALTHFTQRMTIVDSSLRGHLWPIVVTLATLTIAANGGRVGSMRFMDAHFDSKRMPVAAVNFLHNQEARAIQVQDRRAAEVPQCALHSEVLSPDYWGGYLIYRLYPDHRVVIDDRHDFYGEWFLKSYLTTVHLEAGWEKFLRGHSCLLLPTKAPLTQLLRETPAWKVVYNDDLAVVFVLASWPPEDQDKIVNP